MRYKIKGLPKQLLILSSLLMASVFVNHAGAQQLPAGSTYSVVTLSPPLPTLLDINDHGIPAGTGQGDIGGEHGPNPGYLNENYFFVDLEPDQNVIDGFGYAINNHRDMVGFHAGPRFYSNGNVTRLLNLDGVNSFGRAWDLNDDRLIVGCSNHDGNHDLYPVQWHNGGMPELLPGTPVGTLGCAQAVNGLGHAAGSIKTATGEVATLWRNGSMIELGTLPGHSSSIAYAVNDHDQVVGVSRETASGPGRPFLWQNGAMTDLGLLSDGHGIARDINNSGHIVGSAPTPFLWKNGVMYDLNPVAPYLPSPRAINESGQIVSNRYILTPIVTDNDIAVTLSHSPNTVTSDDLVTYTATVINLGRNTATGVTLVDQFNTTESVFHSNHELISVTSSQGTCGGYPTVTCSLGDIAAGATATVTLVTRPIAVIDRGKQYDIVFNRVTVSSNESEINTVNNLDSVHIDVYGNEPPPDADLRLYVSYPNMVNRREPITYHIDIKNNGPLSAHNIHYEQTFSTGVRIERLSSSQGSCSYDNNTVSCSLGDMAAGSVVRSTVSIKSRKSDISSTATVSSDAPDYYSDNNSRTTFTTVQR